MGTIAASMACVWQSYTLALTDQLQHGICSLTLLVLAWHLLLDIDGVSMAYVQLHHCLHVH